MGDVYGVEAASENYFGQSASALAPPSAALLAGAIINPRLLNPAHPTPRLLRRQQMILKRMGAVIPPVEVARSKPAPASSEQPAVSLPDAAPDTLSSDSTLPPVQTDAR
jgi:monofunctional biosynthetic peptidoglycan transglycosylase